MRTTWTFHSAGQLVFGSGSVAQLGSLVHELKLKRLLLVTDRHLASAGVLVPVEAALGEAGIDVEVFDGGQPEPSLDLVDDCLTLARQFQPEGVLGLGGGSNMDLAKCVALVLTHGGTLRDYVGDGRVRGPVMPIICVPTTSGTGSEVTAAAVLTDTANQVKVGVLSNYLRPRLAVVDPRLTLSCPAKVTADSGIDALTHAIEAYTAVDNADFPLARRRNQRLSGAPSAGRLPGRKGDRRSIGRHLARAVREPANLAAREGMALAATLAGLASPTSAWPWCTRWNIRSEG